MLEKKVSRYLPTGAWYVLSLLLLGIYLAYFHWLNVASPDQVPVLGALFASIWLVVCFVCQSIFRNRFEFAIHMLLTADFYLESLVSTHSGYGFYFCGLGFWAVFWIYHHLAPRNPEATFAGTVAVDAASASQSSVG